MKQCYIRSILKNVLLQTRDNRENAVNSRSSSVFLRLRFVDLATSSFFSPFSLSFSFPPDIPTGDAMSPLLSLSVPKYFHQDDRRQTPWRMQACTSSILPIRVFTRIYTVHNTVSMTFARESRARSSIPFVTACVKENAGGHIHARMCPLRSRKRDARSIVSRDRDRRRKVTRSRARKRGEI